MIYLFKENENYFIKNDETNETYQLELGKNKNYKEAVNKDDEANYDFVIPQFDGHNTQKYINQVKLKNYLLSNEKLILNEKSEKSPNEKTQNYSRKSSKVEKYNWFDYTTPEEQKTIDEIKAKCIERHEKRMNNPKRLEILANIDKLLKIKTDDEDIALLVSSKLEKLNKMLEEIDKN